MAPDHLTADGELYWQGRPLDEALTTQAVQPRDYKAVLIYAISCMSHHEILNIVKRVKELGASRIVVFENSQAVTGYDITQTIPFYKEAGADYLLEGGTLFQLAGSLVVLQRGP